jgi:high-affinity Fe2+/Pb2+ permease
MWLLRLLAVILVVAIGTGLLIYVITGNRNYLAFAGRLFRYGIVFALIIFALMIIERVAVIPV